MKIWKAVLVDDEFVQDIEIPEFSRVLSTGIDPDGKLCVWFICHPENQLVKRHVTLCYTGNTEAPDTLKNMFIGTVVMSDGIVLHVFVNHGILRFERTIPET